MRRTRSATKSLPSDSPSPSARTLALRRLKDAKSKRKLSYGGEDEGAGGSNKAARYLRRFLLNLGEIQCPEKYSEKYSVLRNTVS